MTKLYLTPEQLDLAVGLNSTQRHMVMLLVSGDCDTDEAAYLAAGGSPGLDAQQSARDQMEIPSVQAFHDSLKVSHQKTKIMTRDEALQRLSVIGRATVKDVANFSRFCAGENSMGVEVYQTAWSLKNSDEMSDDGAALISELTSTKDGFRFKTHNQLDAIKQIAAMEGWNYLGKKPGDKEAGKSLLNENLTDVELEAGIKLLLSAAV